MRNLSHLKQIIFTPLFNITLRNFIILLLSLTLFPQLASADVAFGLFQDHWPALFLIIPVETIIFYHVFNKLFIDTNIVKKELTIIKTFIIVTLANIASYYSGILIETVFEPPPVSHQFAIGKSITLGVAFFLSALIEWIVYIPFFRQIAVNIKKMSNLFKVSIITNLIPYLLLAILIIPKPHPSLDPDRGRDAKARATAKNFYNLAMAYLADKESSIPDEQAQLQLTPDSLPDFEVEPYIAPYIIIKGGPLVYDYKNEIVSFITPMTFRHKNSSIAFRLKADGTLEERK